MSLVYVGQLEGSDADGDSLTYHFDYNLVLSVATTLNLGLSLPDLKTSLLDFISNAYVQTIVNNSTAINSISSTDIDTTLITSISSASTLQDIDIALNSLSGVNFDSITGDLSISKSVSDGDVNTLIDQNILLINVSTDGIVSIGSELFKELSDGDSAKIEFDYYANDGLINSESSTVTINMQGSDVEVTENKLTVLSDEGDFELGELLSSIPNSPTTGLDTIDLYAGDHILSNINIEDFLAIAEGNTLVINKDSSDDKVIVNLDIWNPVDDAITNGYDVYHASYTPEGGTEQTLSLLIEQTPPEVL